MNEPFQFIIVAAFAVFCFGFGYLTAFIVTRNKWRDEMIERRIARYDWHTGKWEWGEPPIISRISSSTIMPRRFPPPWSRARPRKTWGGRTLNSEKEEAAEAA